MHFRRSAPVLSALFLAACAHESPGFVCVRGEENKRQCAQKLAEGDLERADTYCDLGLEFSPQSADLWANKGLIALYRGDTAKAKERLLLALQYNPDHREARVHLGSAYLEEGAYEQARECFVQAVKGDPKFVPARYALGLALMKLGRRAEARTELDAVLAADPSHVDAHHSLGVLDYEEEKLEGAFQHLSRVAQLTPDAPVVWMELGTVLMAQRRFSEAEVAFGHCVLLEEAHADCRKGLAQARRASSP